MLLKFTLIYGKGGTRRFPSNNELGRAWAAPGQVQVVWAIPGNLHMSPKLSLLLPQRCPLTQRQPREPKSRSTGSAQGRGRSRGECHGPCLGSHRERSCEQVEPSLDPPTAIHSQIKPNQQSGAGHQSRFAVTPQWPASHSLRPRDRAWPAHR
jgi:hypothetical protein